MNMNNTMTLEKEKAGGCSLQRFVGRLGSTAELYNADCADVIGRLGTVDGVITDPPYGIGSTH